jgi:hypothetical protein
VYPFLAPDIDRGKGDYNNYVPYLEQRRNKTIKTANILRLEKAPQDL